MVWSIVKFCFKPGNPWAELLRLAGFGLTAFWGGQMYAWGYAIAWKAVTSVLLITIAIVSGWSLYDWCVTPGRDDEAGAPAW